MSAIALCMKANPALKLGIPGSIEACNQNLSNRRISTFGGVLIDAGVQISGVGEGPVRDRPFQRVDRAAAKLAKPAISPWFTAMMIPISVILAENI